MTRESQHDLARAFRRSYRRTNKAEKGRMLKQFALATGYHRKHAMKLVKHGPPELKSQPRVGHTPYGIILRGGHGPIEPALNQTGAVRWARRCGRSSQPRHRLTANWVV